MKHLPFLSGIHPIMITTIISLLLLKVMQLNMKNLSSSSPLQLTTFHKLLKFVCVSVCNCACWAVILSTDLQNKMHCEQQTPRQNVWTTNSFWGVRQIIFITQLNFKSKTQVKNYSFIHKKKCFFGILRTHNRHHNSQIFKCFMRNGSCSNVSKFNYILQHNANRTISFYMPLVLQIGIKYNFMIIK